MSEKVSISNLNKNAGLNTGSGISFQDVEEDNIPTLENPNIKPSRTIADLSQLPKEEKEPKGVILKTTVEDELLGEGSVFEDYIAKKQKEREELDAAIDAHNEMVAAKLGEEVPEEITDEDVVRSTEALNEQENPTDEFDNEVEDPSDYVDPLEKELEEEEDNTISYVKPKLAVSNIEEVEKGVKLWRFTHLVPFTSEPMM